MGRTALEILEDRDFKELYRRRMGIAWALTGLELVLFFGFIALVAFDRPLIGREIGPGSATTLGIPLAVGVILLSWVLTGIYVHWANSTFDALAKRVREKIGG